jgi:hypothetical protein
VAKKNIEMALKYLLMISESNAEESGFAADMVRKIRSLDWNPAGPAFGSSQSQEVVPSINSEATAR